MIKVLCRFFEKKLRKKLSCRKVFGEFSKIVRSTVVVNRRALLLLCYAIGVRSLNFNITNIELGCRHCRPFLKKGSAKNFPTGKILDYFSKIVRSIEMCSRLSVFLFILSGLEA